MTNGPLLADIASSGVAPAPEALFARASVHMRADGTPISGEQMERDVTAAINWLRRAEGPIGVLVAADSYATRCWAIAILACGLSAVVVDNAAPGDGLRTASERFGASWLVGTDQGPQTCRTRSSALWSAEQAASGLIFLTSGSTGRPRGLFHPREHLWREAALVAERLDYRPDAVLACTVPAAHLFGFTVSALAPALTGTAVVSASPLTVGGFASLVAKSRPSWIAAVPQQYGIWSSRAPAQREPVDALCISSGGQLSAATRTAFRETWGADIVEQYGSSECGAIAIAYDASVIDTGGVGRPYRDVEVRAGIDGAAAPVLVRSGHGATAIVEGAGKWIPLNRSVLDTGDLGWLDDADCLRITGRRRGILNVHGRKVGVAEVEECLRAVDGVTEAHVVAGEEFHGDQVVLAVVEVARGVDVNEQHLRVECSRTLAPWKVPRRILIAEHLDRTAAGKVSRATVSAVLSAAGLRVAEETPA